MGDCFVTKLTADGDIDTLFPATYLGGVEYDVGNDIVVDQDDNILVVGTTYSDDFPTTANAFQPAIARCPEAASSEAFVAKYSSTGAVIYATFLGGMGEEQGNGIDVDVCGNAYVTGYTNVSSMETCTDVFPQVNAPAYTATPGDCINDAFVTKLNTAGTQAIFSTCLGGHQRKHGLWQRYRRYRHHCLCYR